MDRAGVLAELEQRYGLPRGILAAQEQIESSGGRDPSMSRVPGSHADGAFQFQPGTWAEFGRGDIHSERDSAEAAARYDAALLARAGYNPSASAEANQQAIAQALAGYRGATSQLNAALAGNGPLDIDHTQGGLRDVLIELTAVLRANARQSPTVTINNQTGGAVATIANAAATQR